MVEHRISGSEAAALYGRLQRERSRMDWLLVDLRAAADRGETHTVHVVRATLREVLDTLQRRGTMPARNNDSEENEMAQSSVKAVSPRITLDIDLDEAKKLKEVLAKEREGKSQFQSTPDALASVRSALYSGIDDAEAIIKGVNYVGEV